jgi:hypothetical protein
VLTQPEDSEWFRQRGGAQVGRWYTSWPFVTLRVGPDGIEFRVLMRRYLIAKSEIRKLRVVKLLIDRGVSVSHSSPRAPEDLVFWSRNPVPLIDAFTRRGYAVEPEE